MGSIFSIALFIALIVYGLKRFLLILSLKQITIFSHYNYGEADNDTAYYGEQIGLKFAFGISDWDGNTPSEEVLADYGTINAYYERWNDKEDILTKVKTRPCELADFGLNPDEKQAN